MLLTAGCPGLPLPAQGWTLDSAPPWTRTSPHYYTFSPGVNIGVGTGERHYLFFSYQNSRALAYQRGKASESQTPDTRKMTNWTRCQAAMGHCIIAGHPTSLTAPAGLSLPVRGRSCSCPQPRDFPGTITRVGVSRRRMALLKQTHLLHLPPPFTQESDSAGAWPAPQPPPPGKHLGICSYWACPPSH